MKGSEDDNSVAGLLSLGRFGPKIVEAGPLRVTCPHHRTWSYEDRRESCTRHWCLFPFSRWFSWLAIIDFPPECCELAAPEAERFELMPTTERGAEFQALRFPWGPYHLPLESRGSSCTRLGAIAQGGHQGDALLVLHTEPAIDLSVLRDEAERAVWLQRSDVPLRDPYAERLIRSAHEESADRGSRHANWRATAQSSESSGLDPECDDELDPQCPNERPWVTWLRARRPQPITTRDQCLRVLAENPPPGLLD